MPSGPASTVACPAARASAGLEVLDTQAQRAYQARLAQLDPERDAQERHWLEAQLSAGTGLGGRPRTTGSTDERARVAVRKAVVAALARIAESDPALGRHLRDRVRTGYLCRYETDRDHPLRWDVGQAGAPPHST